MKAGPTFWRQSCPDSKRRDINIQLSDNYLTITAEHRTESEEKDKKGNYIRRERTWGQLQPEL